MKTNQSSRRLKFCLATIYWLLAVCLFAVNAEAAPLADARSGPLSVHLERLKADVYKLTFRVAGSKEVLSPKVFAIENPIRLVIDLPVSAGKGAQNVDLKDARLGALRLGIHPDKTRVVLDVKGTDVPKFSSSAKHSEPGVAQVDFAFSADEIPSDTSEADFTDEEWKEPPAVNKTPEPAPVKTPEAKKTPEPKKTAEPVKTSDILGGDTEADEAEQSPEPELEPTKQTLKEATPVATAVEPVAKITPSPAATKDVESDLAPEAEAPPTKLAREDKATVPANFAGNVVKTIYYQTLENTRVPAVAFEVSKLGSYSMNQIKPDLYELSLDNSRLVGKHLTLPQFPPDTFKGFQVVVAREEGGKVLVRMYVEDGAKLFPFVAKGTLWVKISGITNP